MAQKIQTYSCVSRTAPWTPRVTRAAIMLLLLIPVACFGAVQAAAAHNDNFLRGQDFNPGAGQGGINYGSGFISKGLVLNQSATLNGTRLRLTDGGTGE